MKFRSSFNLTRFLLGSLSVAVALPSAISSAHAGVIYASGQRLTQALPGHNDIRENFIYAIDPLTGVATPVSPQTSGLPPALAGTPNQQLLGFNSGQLVQVDHFTATQTNIGGPSGLEATGFDILTDGRGFIIPFNANSETQQLYTLDLSAGSATSIGSPTAVGDAIDNARGTPLGTAEPFIISLGSVGNTLYGVDLDTDSLISFDPGTGNASVVGTVGAVTNGALSVYSGFSALTGVDTNNDGAFDALFGNVNFIDEDNNPNTPSQRLGGIARYNLGDGTWSLVGTNPGVIFFGFGSSPDPIPEPTSSLALLGFGACGVLLRVAALNKK